VSYPYRDTETVKAAVKAAQEQHLDDDGEVLADHHAEVRAISIILSHMVCDFVPDIGFFFIDMDYSLISLCFLPMQVERIVQKLKHKLRPEYAYFNALEFDAILSAPKEELHQLLIGLYGEHLLPATMYEIEQTLRGPDTITGYDKNKALIYIISKKRLKNMFARLRNQLSSLDSSTSTIEISTEYAAQFFGMMESI
jgi:hypothetical protein